MIIVMKPGASKKNIENVLGIIRTNGLEPHLSDGKEVTIIGVVGDKTRLMNQNKPWSGWAMQALAGMSLQLCPVLALLRAQNRFCRLQKPSKNPARRYFAGARTNPALPLTPSRVLRRTGCA